jgi:hypothetical protein
MMILLGLNLKLRHLSSCSTKTHRWNAGLSASQRSQLEGFAGIEPERFLMTLLFRVSLKAYQMPPPAYKQESNTHDTSELEIVMNLQMA